MQIVNTVDEMVNLSRQWGVNEIGLVPTMGSLHSGHISLVKEALINNDIVVISIFVNPIQFGEGEDFDSYPRDLDADVNKINALFTEFQVDKKVIVFAPNSKEMYKESFSTKIIPQKMTNVLCGRSRPGHFEGVCTVVAKLFNIIKPHKAYFGQKDAQQVAIINRMVRDLNFDIDIKVCPIVREQRGLALSSRNAYLDDQQKEDALKLYSALNAVKQAVLECEINKTEINCETAVAEGIKLFESSKNMKVDYLELLDYETLEPYIPGVSKKLLLAMAVFVGKTRLIDNLIIDLQDHRREND